MDGIHAFEIGDCIQFKEWDELVQEYGMRRNGIDAPTFFNPKMRYLCGQTAHIERFNRFNPYEFTTEEHIEDKDDNRWVLNIAFIKPFEEDQCDDIPLQEWEQLLAAQ